MAQDVDMITPSIRQYHPQVIRDTLARDAFMEQESESGDNKQTAG